MKFTGSIIGKIFLIIICLILGIVIAIGGEILAVYMLLTKADMGTIEEYAGENIADFPIDFDEEIENKTVLEWGTSIIEAVTNLNATTVGQLEGMVGYPLLSDALNEILGADVEVIKDATFDKLGATIADSMTLGNISEKMEIALPDMPLFNNAEFLDAPISTAFEDLTEYTLGNFIDISEEESNAIMLALKDLTIEELGGEKFTETINGLKLIEIIDITEDSNQVLQSIKDLTLGELTGDEANEVINSMFMGEIMTIDETSTEVLQSLKYSTLESVIIYVNKAEFDASTATYVGSTEYDASKEVAGYTYLYSELGEAFCCVMEDGAPAVENVSGEANYKVYKTKYFENKNRPIIGINDKIGDLKLSELMEITEDDKLLWSLRDSSVSTLADDVNRLLIGEIMEINSESSKTMQALRYSALSDCTTKVPVSSVVVYSDDVIEEDGYIYIYTKNENDEYIPYVAIIGEDGKAQEVVEGGINYYVVYETKTFENKARPLIGIDSKMQEMFIAEIVEVDTESSKTLQAIQYATVESQICEINKNEFDASTAVYKATAEYDVNKEEAGDKYLYATNGIAFVCQVDENGDEIIVEKDGVNFYKVYKTRLFDEKLRSLKGIDDKMNEVTISEIIEIDASSSKLIQSLGDAKINELDGKVKRLLMDEIIEIDSTSSRIIQTIRYSTLNSVIDRIEKDNAVDYSGSDVIDGYVYKEIDGKVFVCVIDEYGDPIIETISGTDYYKVYETKSYESKLYPLIGLDETVSDLTLSNVFSDEQMETGILGLVSPETKLNDISTEIASTIQETTLSTLIGVGVIDDSSFEMGTMPNEQKSFILNGTMTETLSGMISFVNAPVKSVGGTIEPNYDVICPTHYPITETTYSSISDFVNDYEMFGTLSLGANLTVNVDATIDERFACDEDDDGMVDYYVIPMFNSYSNSYVITFTEAVKLGVVDKNTGEIDTHQYGYYYYSNPSQTLDSYAITIVKDEPDTP